MSTAVSNDIRITAEPRYERSQSDPRGARYLFSYRITITNTGRDTVQLLHRHWFIRDSLSPMHEVEGPGVIGQTPVLRPGQEFTYTSACELRSAFGSMNGWYLMERTGDGYQFKVTIPEMQLGFPVAAN
ncbi:MAG: Co2+/Mg2+ efflux protein ApaG [Flavobacteriales bacterium]|nr:Co2+/Mg2+ efflux protein ApaG [Flavobacteriales bacterium]